MIGRSGLLLTALVAATAMGAGYQMTGEFAELPPRKPKGPEDKRERLRRELADQERLAKAEAKRQRKAAKRLGTKVGADDTALERPNVEVTGSPALSASPRGLPG